MGRATANEELEDIAHCQGQSDADNHQLNEAKASFSKRSPEPGVLGPTQSGTCEESEREGNPEWQSKDDTEGQRHQCSKGHQFSVREVGEAGSAINQGQPNRGQSEHETEVDAIYQALDDLVAEGDNLSFALADEEVLDHTSTGPNFHSLSGAALKNGNSLGQRALIEGDVVDSALGNTDYPFAFAVGDDLSAIAVVGDLDADIRNRLTLVLHISRDAEVVFFTGGVSDGRRCRESSHEPQDENQHHFEGAASAAIESALGDRCHGVSDGSCKHVGHAISLASPLTRGVLVKFSV